MRLPTARDELYRWHAEALAGFEPVNDGSPQCGWYTRKLVKGGVHVPARIWMFQDVDQETGELLSDESLQCEVNGRWADPEQEWSWICQDPITEQQFLYLTARIAHAVQHEPDDAFADPRKPVDWLKIPLPSFRKD